MPMYSGASVCERLCIFQNYFEISSEWEADSVRGISKLHKSRFQGVADGY